MQFLFTLAALFLHFTQRKGMHSMAETLQNNASPQTLYKGAARMMETGEMNSTVMELCRAYDGDKCGCATQEHCEFDMASENLCLPSNKGCNVNDFWPHGCRRRNAFYVVGGKLCYNTVTSGDCMRDLLAKSNYAINLNGVKHEDKNGIKYLSHNSTFPPSQPQHIVYRNASNYGTSICKKKGRGDKVEIINYTDALSDDDVKMLLWTYVEGLRPNQITGDDNNCIAFEMVFVEDGVYELDLKSVEMEYSESGLRQFDFKINGKIILSNVDLYRLIRMECVLIDLVLNFFVGGKQKFIVLDGYDPMLLTNSSATIELCNSRCTTVPEPIFIANAFSVTRLHGNGPFCG